MVTSLRSTVDTQLKTVSILGATGSIGDSTMAMLSQHRSRFRVIALTAQDDVEKLSRLAREHHAAYAAIGNGEKYRELKQALSGSGIACGAGTEALQEAAGLPSDIVVSSIVGAAGLLPTLTAIRRGTTVALANKECLVCAGDLIMEAVRKHNATLLPVDSEHSAVFQVLDPLQKAQIERLTLTASGGPFREYTVQQMQQVTPEQAVKHPTWSMGAKISVDSATLMNKGLELIEAYHLFHVEKSQLNIVIHPESVIHGMVHYRDGSVLAQMSPPDMRTPIAYALGYPDRIAAPTERLDLARIGKLTFHEPDATRFPALRLAREALATGGTAPAILNAANEVAVARFLNNEIGFLEIMEKVASALSSILSVSNPTLDDIFAADEQARASART